MLHWWGPFLTKTCNLMFDATLAFWCIFLICQLLHLWRNYTIVCNWVDVGLLTEKYNICPCRYLPSQNSGHIRGTLFILCQFLPLEWCNSCWSFVFFRHSNHLQRIIWKPHLVSLWRAIRGTKQLQSYGWTSFTRKTPICQNLFLMS